MRKPVLLESLIAEVEVLDEKIVNKVTGDMEMYIKVKKWQEADTINANGRRYRRSLLQREIDVVNERIAAGEAIWGHPFHPKDGQGKTDEVSHKWTKVYMNEDGTCGGLVTVLPTTTGKNIQVLLKSGPVGLSSRGFGTATQKEEVIDGEKTKFLDVNDDYGMVVPGDWVTSPSVRGARGQAEAIMEIESELNQGLDLIKNSEINQGVTMKNIEELREKHPDLVKQIEDEKETALKAEAAKPDEKKDTEIADLKKTVTEKDEKIITLEAENKTLKEAKETTLGEIRKVISSASDIEGVLPESTESDPDPVPENETALKKELDKTKADLKEANEKNVTLESEKKTKEDSEQTEADEAKSQKDMREKLDTLMAQDEYKVYAEFIEEEVVKDEKITIKSVDEVEVDVKAAFDKISKIRASGMKDEILVDGFKEKGRIQNPEGGSASEEAESLRIKRHALYQQSLLAGFKGTYEEWEKEYPKLVESVV